MTKRNPNPDVKAGNRTNAEVARDGAWVVKEKIRRPSHLTVEQRKIWNKVVKAAPEGTLTALDENTLAMYCVAVDQYWTAQDEIKTNGQTVKGSTGSPVMNPALRLQKSLYPEILKLGMQLGLTPLSRQSQRTPLDQAGNSAKSRSKFDGLLNAG